jgi:hypothetical protein
MKNNLIRTAFARPNGISSLVIAAILGALLSLIGNSIVMSVTLPGHTDYSAIINRTYLRAFFMYGFMLLGIFANAVHSSSNRLKNASPFHDVLKSSGLRAAVLVSPIIFFGIYKLAKDTPDDIVALCLAFQNGFFWKSILRKTG